MLQMQSATLPSTVRAKLKSNWEILNKENKNTIKQF